MEPRGSLSGVRSRMCFAASGPKTADLSSSNADFASLVKGRMISSRNRPSKLTKLSPLLLLRRKRLPTICRSLSLLINSGGTSMRNSGRQRMDRVCSDKRSTNLSILSMDNVPPLHLSGCKTCNAKYRGGAAS